VPTVKQALRGATEVGTVHLSGNTVILFPGEDQIELPRKIRVVHQDVSWMPTASLRPIKLRNTPTRSQIAGLPRIGRMWKTDNRLMVMLRPSLIKGFD
jgi:hypothetical protein